MSSSSQNRNALYYIFKQTALYEKMLRWSWMQETRIREEERRLFTRDAEKHFREDAPHGSIADYKGALRRHRVTYAEYMYAYEYWRLDEAGRDAFVSRSEMQCIYRKIVTREVRQTFRNKTAFLERFAPFVHREWRQAENLSSKDFRAFVEAHDLIAKPLDGTCGEGVFKISAGDVQDWEALYARCRDHKLLLEECVRACEPVEQFHPASLNTIRVVTLSQGDKFAVFGALFRMGVHGNVIDNTHAGGIFAPVNPVTGRIESPAVDAQNHRYERHPDTDTPIVGFAIPCWEQVVETCRKAAQVMPDLRFAGWDLCPLADGHIELIEGNHAPDFDGGLQAPLKTGVKRKLQATAQEVFGIDVLELIKTTSKTYNHYEGML
mgnify:CR=1 FL=1